MGMLPTQTVLRFQKELPCPPLVMSERDLVEGVAVHFRCPLGCCASIIGVPELVAELAPAGPAVVSSVLAPVGPAVVSSVVL